MQLRITRVVKIFLIVNFVFFVIQQTVDRFILGPDDFKLLYIFGLVPSLTVSKGWLWQLFTYAFLHGEVMHLFLNMLMLVFVGSEIEQLWGARRFIAFYVFCLFSAGVAYLIMQIFVMGGTITPMVGASGAIFGLLLAYGIIFSERTLLFMLLFPMKAKHLIWILAGFEFMVMLFSPSGGLSSVAHLAGMGAGFVYMWVEARFRIRQKQKGLGGTLGKKSKKGGGPLGLFKKKKKKPGHLKLVVNKDRVEFEKTDHDPSDPRNDSNGGSNTWH